MNPGTGPRRAVAVTDVPQVRDAWHVASPHHDGRALTAVPTTGDAR